MSGYRLRDDQPVMKRSRITGRECCEFSPFGQPMSIRSNSPALKLGIETLPFYRVMDCCVGLSPICTSSDVNLAVSEPSRDACGQGSEIPSDPLSN